MIDYLKIMVAMVVLSLGNIYMATEKAKLDIKGDVESQVRIFFRSEVARYENSNLGVRNKQWFKNACVECHDLKFNKKYRIALDHIDANQINP